MADDPNPFIKFFGNRGRGGYVRHPTGQTKGHPINPQTPAGENLAQMAKLEERTTEDLGWDCELDGCKTVPLHNGTICVVCGDTYGDVSDPNE